MVVERDPGLRLVAPAVHDADRAVELCDEHRPDVVLMDIEFKVGMSGIEATRRIKESSPATKVVIMTAHDDERLLVEAVEAGASGFLGKDEPADGVLAAAKAAAEGEVLIDPSTLARLLHQVTKEREEQREIQARFAGLSEREREILRHVAQGRTERRHRHRPVHQPPDRPDARSERPGQAGGPLQARGRRVGGAAQPDRALSFRRTEAAPTALPRTGHAKTTPLGHIPEGPRVPMLHVTARGRRPQSVARGRTGLRVRSRKVMTGPPPPRRPRRTFGSRRPCDDARRCVPPRVVSVWERCSSASRRP